MLVPSSSVQRFAGVSSAVARLPRCVVTPQSAGGIGPRGLALTPEKRYLAESRLAAVCRRFELDDLCELVAGLRSGRDRDLELAVTEAMTTNETLFFRVRRRDPKRWGSLSTMYRLWEEFRKDQTRQREEERRFVLMEQQFRQFQEKSKRASAEMEERLRQIESDFKQRNPYVAREREHALRQLKELESQMNDVLLKLPPQFRDLLRR